MIQELRHRIDPFPARWAASNHNTAPALSNRRRFINEVRKIVAVDFFLDCSKQNRFLHGLDS
jgi:hypothetical protein